MKKRTIFGNAFIKLLQITILPYICVSMILGIGGLTAGQAKLMAQKAGILLLLFSSNPLISDALLRSLEDDFPVVAAESSPAAGAIVVLGGMTFAPVPPRIDVEVGEAFDRLLHGMRLLRAGKAPVLLLSGGDLGTLADLLGHKDVSTTKNFYGLFTVAELKEKHRQHTPVTKLFGERERECYN